MSERAPVLLAVIRRRRLGAAVEVVPPTPTRTERREPPATVRRAPVVHIGRYDSLERYGTGHPSERRRTASTAWLGDRHLRGEIAELFREAQKLRA